MKLLWMAVRAGAACLTDGLERWTIRSSTSKGPSSSSFFLACVCVWVCHCVSEWVHICGVRKKKPSRRFGCCSCFQFTLLRCGNPFGAQWIVVCTVRAIRQVNLTGSPISPSVWPRKRHRLPDVSSPFDCAIPIIARLYFTWQIFCRLCGLDRSWGIYWIEAIGNEKKQQPS